MKMPLPQVKAVLLLLLAIASFAMQNSHAFLNRHIPLGSRYRGTVSSSAFDFESNRSQLFVTSNNAEAELRAGKGDILKHTSNDDGKHNGKDAEKLASCVEFIDPETGCEVVLVGCFHGTVSSSQDVERMITPETKAVAVELCAKRFTDLLNNEQLEQQRQEQEKENEKEQPTWWNGYVQMVQQTAQRRGMGTAIATAVVGGVSGLQTLLSGFTPGLEFTTALQATRNNPDCDLFCVDQSVDDTLQRMGELPFVAWSMIMGTHYDDANTLSDGGSSSSMHHPKANPVQRKWQRIIQDAGGLSRAINGASTSSSSSTASDGSMDLPQVQISQVLFRNPSAVKDLLRLMVPPLVVFNVGIMAVNAALLSLVSANLLDPSLVVLPTDAASIPQQEHDRLPHILASLMIVLCNYFFIALPAARVVLLERDMILSDGIRATCRHVVQQNDGVPGRVVAVLGLLHVNGVAYHMTTSGGAAQSSEDDESRRSRQSETLQETSSFSKVKV